MKKLDRKILWIDTETTGLIPGKNAMIQLAALLVINGSVKEEINLLCRPFKGAVIEQSALDINKRTKEDIMIYPTLVYQISVFKDIIDNYINKYDKNDKFVIAGYNVRFDIGFLRDGFNIVGDKYFGSRFFSAPIDVMTIVALCISQKQLRLRNYQLKSVSDKFHVSLDDAHDALADIKATRNLFFKLIKHLKSK